ncbi:hypothetical protein BMETH_2445180209, partial [methanotrophic bacterial endosymbiont of Bathymodiolus sp.]
NPFQGGELVKVVRSFLNSQKASEII